MATSGPVPSIRSFGLTFATVFALLGLLPWFVGGPRPYVSLLLIAAALLAVTFLVPRVLVWPNLTWFRIGLLLHGVFNPVLMALAYYGAFLPVGLVMRLFGDDSLHLKWDKRAPTYWIDRAATEPPPGSMTKQF